MPIQPYAGFMISYSENLVARLRDPLIYLLAGATLIIAAVNISTRLSDAADLGAAIPWQDPVVSEYTSAVAIIVLLPLLFAFFDVKPLRLAKWYRFIALYFLASILFSLAHVGLMVGMREIIWPLALAGDYRFFAGGYGELLYEYRKDGITFLLYLLIWELQRQIKAARAIAAMAEEPLTLKSGATTILLQPAEFLYATGAGNYAEITSLSGKQLARTTLKDLLNDLQQKGCHAVRIHRSAIVNKSAIMETKPLAGGDLTVKLRGGETLRASRRFKSTLE